MLDCEIFIYSFTENIRAVQLHSPESERKEFMLKFVVSFVIFAGFRDLKESADLAGRKECKENR